MPNTGYGGIGGGKGRGRGNNHGGGCMGGNVGNGGPDLGGLPPNAG